MIPDATSERASEESKLCALAYLVWPIAVYERIAPRADASSWYRVHMRQAFRFGSVAALATLVALGWPLIASAWIGSIGTMLAVYGIAIAIDLGGFAGWLLLALRYSRRAAQGAFFTIGWLGGPGGGRSPKL